MHKFVAQVDLSGELDNKRTLYEILIIDSELFL